MLLATVFFPLIGSILLGFCGRFFGVKGAGVIACLSTAIPLCLTVILYALYGTEAPAFTINIYNWIRFGSFDVDISFLFDSLTFTMLVVVLGVSTIVHMYSTDYLKNDPHLVRFLAYLNLFTFFMLVLVSAENFIQLFLGWEGVGVCSYLLISFWYSRIQANKSALKAVFVNKVGDVSLLVAMGLLYQLVGTLSFSVLAPCIPYVNGIFSPFFGGNISLLEIVAMFLIMAAVGKSAQVGLHIWLPDAMEGPTPVSALLHAATMVTAGVFLILRCSFVFAELPLMLLVITFIGSISALMAATIGLMQNDIKRIIAFSTCSQLGYMFVSCGLAQYSTALFHLFNHAFFKALLFLAAGSVIHALSDEQDIRKMGSLWFFLPMTFTFFSIASFSLMGVPGLSGFFSKDLIIELAMSSSFFTCRVLSFFLLLAAFFTAAYSFRLLYYVFLARSNFVYFAGQQAIEPPFFVQVALCVLCVASIFSGYIFSDYFVGPGTNYFDNVFFFGVHDFRFIDVEFLNPFYKNLPLVFSLCGLLLGYFGVSLSFTYFFPLLRAFFVYWGIFLFNQKWFFDKFYMAFGLFFYRLFYFWFFWFLDKGIIENFGPAKLYIIARSAFIFFKRFQSGVYVHYLLFVFSAFWAIFFFLLAYVF